MTTPNTLRGTNYGIQRTAVCPLHPWRTLHSLCEAHDMPPVYDYVVVEVVPYSADNLLTAYSVRRSNGDYLVYGSYSGAYAWITRNS